MLNYWDTGINSMKKQISYYSYNRYIWCPFGQPKKKDYIKWNINFVSKEKLNLKN